MRQLCGPTGTQLDANGKEIPSGLKAFRINVLYDILRGAAQSGEFEADPKQRQANGVPQPSQQLSMASTPAAGNKRQLDDVVVPGAPGDTGVSRSDHRGLHSSSAAMSSFPDAITTAKGQDGQVWDDVSFHHPVASGLSEAMEFTKRVRLRAEVRHLMFLKTNSAAVAPCSIILLEQQCNIPAPRLLEMCVHVVDMTACSRPSHRHLSVCNSMMPGALHAREGCHVCLLL